MEVEEAVGKAVRAALDAALPCPVYDHPPRNAAYPYVRFERHTTQPDDLVALHMTRHDIALSVWADTRGVKAVRDIVGRIRRALHHQNLALDAGHAALVEIERADITQDADGVTYMGTVTVAVLTNDD